MRVAVTTFFTPSYKQLAEITTVQLDRYCSRHGYFLNVNEVPEGNVDFVITKDTRRLLDEYDVVMAIENDILITNHTIKIESFLDDDNHFYVCKDVNGVNGGCFIVKSTYAGKYAVGFVAAMEGIYKTEQNVLERYINDNRILPHPSINSIPYDYYYPSYGYIGYKEGEVREKPTLEQGNWVAGNFNMHLPAVPLNRRIEIFKNHLKDIIYD